jgi:hypothetical protein
MLELSLQNKRVITTTEMVYRRKKRSNQESKTSVHLTTGFPARAAEELQGHTKSKPRGVST